MAAILSDCSFTHKAFLLHGRCKMGGVASLAPSPLQPDTSVNSLTAGCSLSKGFVFFTVEITYHCIRQVGDGRAAGWQPLPLPSQACRKCGNYLHMSQSGWRGGASGRWTMWGRGRSCWCMNQSVENPGRQSGQQVSAWRAMGGRWDNLVEMLICSPLGFMRLLDII